MPALSIIVPVYNKERYIDDCIKSVLGQTFTDFELILVNDGSSDTSGAKCDEYSRLDSRVRVIHQVNAGVSAARNSGLKNAQGRYIGFIDSDDTIAPDMYEVLVRNLETYNADISVCRLRVVFPGKLVTPAESEGISVLNHEQGLCACLKGELDRSANNKIYKAELAARFSFEGQMYEDILYTCKVFLEAGKTVVENVVKYNYMVRDNSTSMSRFGLKYMQTVDVSAEIVKLIAGESESCLSEAKVFDIVANISLLNLLLMSGKEQYPNEYKRVINTLSGYKSFINQTTGLAKKHSYALKAFFFSPWLYTALMYGYCRLTGADVIKRTQPSMAA